MKLRNYNKMLYGSFEAIVSLHCRVDASEMEGVKHEIVQYFF